MIKKAKALYQVKLILDYLPEEEYKLIPKETIDYIEDNFEYDQNIVIDPNIPLEQQKIDDKAYEMLDDETKKKYSNLDSFVNDIDNIYANLFTSFKATSKKENDDNIVYKVQNRNMDTITITEYFPNDYKIGFNFE